jgi:phage protein D
MEVATLESISRTRGGFYVPSFEIQIEGANLPDNVLRDVLQVTYKDHVKEIDWFELVVNNWNSVTNTFKYIGSENEASLKKDTEESRYFRLLEPSNKEIKLSMGYDDERDLMLTGVLTTMEPNFPSSGGPTLTVRGLNVLHQLRKKQYTTVWTDTTDSKIAKAIGKRFPIPIKIDDNMVGKEPALKYVAQDNQYDIDFLLIRARQRGYVVFVSEQKKKGQGPVKWLYFGPSEANKTSDVQESTIELEWGKSLIDFKPTLTTANQIRSVTVKGWNRKTRKPISETVTIDDKGLKINKDLCELLKRCDAREEQVVDEPVFTEKQAKERAKAILLDRNKEMVKASGTTIGLPGLRAGKKLLIKNLGSRLNGVYFVTDTTHTMNNSGYITRFNARREDDGENK